MPVVIMKHDEDPADMICRQTGNLDDVDVFNNHVLVGLYLRANIKMMLGGKEFHMPDKSKEEDEYQSKIGLILKMGPSAFAKKSGGWFKDQDMSIGDWVFCRPSDGMRLKLVSVDEKTGTKKELLCRLLEDVDIKMRAESPDRLY